MNTVNGVDRRTERIFVTGGLGFTGAALVERLLDDGYSVSVLDQQPGLRKAQLEARGAEVEIGSILSGDALSRGVAGADVVMHLAAAFREIGAPDSVYFEVNVEGTRRVLEAARSAGVRKFVYCSTQGVHGHIEDPPGDEDSPIRPADYYQETKYLGEEVVRNEAGDVEFTILRPTAIYGPGDPGRYVMIYRQAAKGRFLMFGPGDTYYHPVYIDNLVEAFVLASRAGAGAGAEFIIGDADYVSIRTLVEKVARSMDRDVRILRLPLSPLIVAGHVCEKICKPFGVNPPIFPRRVDWFRQVRAFRIDRARRELGYEPRIGLDEGLRRTADWYATHGYLG